MPSTKPYISFIGHQSYVGKTVITWSDKASDRYTNGSEIGTFRTATVRVDSDFFCATAITIKVLSLVSSFFCSSLWSLNFFDLIFLGMSAEHGGGRAGRDREASGGPEDNRGQINVVQSKGFGITRHS